jgi:uncharacterized coiled-coil DUF342 family protein
MPAKNHTFRCWIFLRHLCDIKTKLEQPNLSVRKEDLLAVEFKSLLAKEAAETKMREHQEVVDALRAEIDAHKQLLRGQSDTLQGVREELLAAVAQASQPAAVPSLELEARVAELTSQVDVWRTEADKQSALADSLAQEVESVKAGAQGLQTELNALLAAAAENAVAASPRPSALNTPNQSAALDTTQESARAGRAPRSLLNAAAE